MCDKIEKTGSGQACYYAVQKQPINYQDMCMYIYMYIKSKISSCFVCLYTVICCFQRKMLVTRVCKQHARKNIWL
jgi:hypothetical protein